jgi:hypothetical protein
MEENKTNKKHKPTEEQLIAFDMLKVFYERPSTLKDDSGNPFTVPHDGSLGLLALGHIGLIEWRKSREIYLRENQKKTEDQKSNPGKDL